MWFTILTNSSTSLDVTNVTTKVTRYVVGKGKNYFGYAGASYQIHSFI